MADAGIGFVDIIPRTTSFATSLSKQVGSAISKVQAQTTATSSLTRGLQAGFVALGVVAVAAISKGIAATQEWAAGVRTLQRVTGESAEATSGLLAAGGLLNLDIQKLNTGFGVFAKNITTNNAALKAYGVVTKDAHGETLPFTEVLKNAQDVFQTLKPGIEQTGFAMRLFGRSGKEMIPILGKTSEEMEELIGKASAAGLIMSQDDLNASKELSIAQRELGHAFEGAAISIGKEFIPIATKVVEVISAAVSQISKIPTPVLAAATAISVLTGAVAAIQLVGGFFVGTWTKVLATLGLTGAAETEVTVGAGLATTALELETAAATTLFAAAERLAVVLGVELPAANAATTTSAGLATEALGAEAAAAAAAGASAPAAAARIGLLSRAFGVLKGVAAGGVGIAGLGGFIIGSIPELPKADDLAKINGLLGTLQKGIEDTGGVMAITADHAAFLTKETEFASGAFGANAQAFSLALHAGIPYELALKRIIKTTADTSTSSRELTSSIRSILRPIEDLETPIQDIALLNTAFATSLDKISPALDTLEQNSGQDFGSIRDSVLQALADPKTTVEQLPGIFAGALGQVRELMQQWHDDVVSSFGGASTAISEFLGQAAGAGPDKVSFQNLTDSLHETRGELRRWSSEFDTILSESGGKARRFLQDMSANGLESIGTLDAVAAQPKKIRDAFFTQYNDVNRATDTIATQITDAFGTAADRIVLQLKNLIRAIQGLPPIKPEVDNTQAIASYQEIINKAREAGFGSSQKLDISGFRQKGGNNEALGGVIHGATGFVTQGPVFQIGEGTGQTFAGKGAEAVIPFNERGIGILAEALDRAMGRKSMGVHVTVGFDSSGNLQVRKIARDEIDREQVYRRRVMA